METVLVVRKGYFDGLLGRERLMCKFQQVYENAQWACSMDNILMKNQDSCLVGCFTELMLRLSKLYK